ncbi:MAG: hypothetical protein ABIS14_00230 [Sphingomonas sp.]
MTRSATDTAYASGPAVLIIANGGADSAAAQEAVALAGGRSGGCVTWADATERLARQGAMGVLLVEAMSAGTAAIERVLPSLDLLAREGMVKIIVVLAPEQIDLIAAHLLGEQAELLCAPSMAERTAAVAVALAPAGPPRLHDAGRETEAARLRRLNEEVARIAETLARLSRDTADTPRPSLLGDRIAAYGAPHTAECPAVTATEIRAAIRARRLRDKAIPGGLFEDPAWDMLLDLFAAELERAQVSVSSLCIAAAVAPTTALRWIGKLTDAGLPERHPDPFDRRRAFLALSDRARDGLARYCAAVKHEGLAIA